MYNFVVKSRVNDYSVSFIDSTYETLKAEIKIGDYIIIDNNIIKLYPNIFDKILTETKFIAINATEPQKSYEGIIPIIRQLIETGFKKNNRLIAIGGGITQDVTAFISSILYRGVPWIFFPTTLLAQGDSCIGSKTSINFGDFKNQVGGFYPPSSIYIDLNFLDTLKEMDLKSGLGEMCHYFIVSSEEDFRWYKKEYPKALREKEILTQMISRSLAIKKSYIEIDEYDQKERQVFNYGHSFGHAIESLTQYRIPHGIAVSYGMDMANYISVKLGFIHKEIRQEIKELLEQIWAGTSLTDISLEKFKSALSKDKKNVGNELRLILNKGYGKIFKEALQMDEKFTLWMDEYFTNVLK
ncbi:MAG: 3-dehydroquinate synthase [Ignavibacteria bacterium]|nr:3-dehydroquinate synthase [Ignavibacteria bacterium]